MDKTREIRVKKINETEEEVWGFHAYDRNRPWILKIEKSIQHQCHIKNHEFDSTWVSLTKDGCVTVHASKKKPYAWDGCTPKFAILKKQFIVGTPDGYRDINMELPLTGIASLIHDAFYQYLHVIPFRKSEVDKIFRDILKNEGFILWPIYYLAVRLFGGIRVKQEGLDGVYYEKYRPVFLERQGRQ